MFPEEEEKKIRRIFRKSTKNFQDKLEIILNKEFLTDKDKEILEKEIEKEYTYFEKSLTKTLLSFQNFVYEEWYKNLGRLEKVEVTKHKSWIDKNIKIHKETPKMSYEKLNSIRRKRKEEYLGKISEQFEFRINKKKLSKKDVKYIKNFVKARGYTGKVENIDKFTKGDLKNLRNYVRKRNNFWARDQAGNIYAADCEALALKNGIKRFRWRTEGDVRVRPEHRIRGGKKFYFDEIDYLPGSQKLCRCWMIPLKKAFKK